MASESQAMLAILSTVCLLATLLIAVLLDLASHRIPNTLIVPALLVALAVAVAAAGRNGLLLSLIGLGVGVVFLSPLYLLGALGAGDVKLLGVAGAFLGPVGAVVAGLATFVAGGIIGIVYMVWRRKDRSQTLIAAGARPPLGALVARYPRLAGIFGTRNQSHTQPGLVATRQAKRKKSTFAYAPAICIGTAYAIWQYGWLTNFAMG